MTPEQIACVERPIDHMTKDDMREAIRIYRAEVARLRAALVDVAGWLVSLRPSGHDGDEDSGQCDSNCQRCQCDAIEARIDAALAAGEDDRG